MSSNKDYVLETMRRFGESAARDLQSRAPEMTGTEIYGEKGFLPAFDASRQYLNFTAGYVCVSAAGRAVRLIQPYDSSIYPQQPEELPAQWGFYWSQNPADALPFVSLATSPYNTGDCCTYPVDAEGLPSAEGEKIHVFRSGQNGNVWAPGSVGVTWEDLGPVEQYQGGVA